MLDLLVRGGGVEDGTGAPRRRADVGVRDGGIVAIGEISEADYRLRAETWQDGRVLVGGSDAGAHVDMQDTFAFSSHVLGPAVRDRQLLPLERAVQLITQAPAELIGLKERGTIKEGNWADLVVFDADRIGCGPLHTRFDLPGGAGRLYAEAEGIGHVIVNGTEVVRDNRLTGVEPGRILRSGTDTYTASLAIPSQH